MKRSTWSSIDACWWLAHTTALPWRQRWSIGFRCGLRLGSQSSSMPSPSAQAPDVVAVQRLSLVLSNIGGRMFFKEPDFPRRLAAGTLILVGVFVVGWMQPGKLEALFTG